MNFFKKNFKGAALGDAIGLATEFMTKEQVKQIYGKSELKFGEAKGKDFIRDFHRQRWDEGDWTDDTDQQILVMRMLEQTGGTVDVVDFAGKLRNWILKGFPELGDSGGMGIGQTVSRVVKRQEFLTEPHKMSEDVWERSGREVAPNGAIMRTAVLGIPTFWDTKQVVHNCCEIAKVTHFDPRCQASCIAVCLTISEMMKGKDPFAEKHQHIEKIIQESSFLSIGYTYKCLGSAFWAFYQSKYNFKDAIMKIVREGGDSDTNATVAG